MRPPMRYARGMERIELLRRRIALYRGYLQNGVAAPEAELYLKQIKRDEAAIRAIVEVDAGQGKGRV